MWYPPDLWLALPVDVAATRSGPEAFDRRSTLVGPSVTFPSDLRWRRGCLLLLKEDVLGLEGKHPIVPPSLGSSNVQEGATLIAVPPKAKYFLQLAALGMKSFDV